MVLARIRYGNNGVAVYVLNLYLATCGPKGHGSGLPLPSRTAALFLTPPLHDRVLSPTLSPAPHNGVAVCRIKTDPQLNCNVCLLVCIFYLYPTTRRGPKGHGSSVCMCMCTDCPLNLSARRIQSYPDTLITQPVTLAHVNSHGPRSNRPLARYAAK